MVEIIPAMPSLFEMSSSTVSALEIEEKAPNPTLFIEVFAKMLKNFDEKYDRANDLDFYELDKIFWVLKEVQDNILTASQDDAATVDDKVEEKMQKICLQMFVLERNLKRAQVADDTID